MSAFDPMILLERVMPSYHAKSMLAGNPHFEAGGTVEIRELPPDRLEDPDVCFWVESGHGLVQCKCLLLTQSGHQPLTRPTHLVC